MRTRGSNVAKLTRAAAGLLSAAGILGLVAPAEAGGPAFVEGSGTARAQTARFAPHTGGLTYALTEGVALASYEGTVGRAQAQTLDLGLYGLVLTTVAPCGGKPPLRPEQPPQPPPAQPSGSGPPEASPASPR